MPTTNKPYFYLDLLKSVASKIKVLFVFLIEKTNELQKLADYAVFVT